MQRTDRAAALHRDDMQSSRRPIGVAGATPSCNPKTLSLIRHRPFGRKQDKLSIAPASLVERFDQATPRRLLAVVDLAQMTIDETRVFPPKSQNPRPSWERWVSPGSTARPGLCVGQTGCHLCHAILARACQTMLPSAMATITVTDRQRGTVIAHNGTLLSVRMTALPSFTGGGLLSLGDRAGDDEPLRALFSRMIREEDLDRALQTTAMPFVELVLLHIPTGSTFKIETRP
jgi:hypothetical protein